MHDVIFGLSNWGRLRTSPSNSAMLLFWIHSDLRQLLIKFNHLTAPTMTGQFIDLPGILSGLLLDTRIVYEQVCISQATRTATRAWGCPLHQVSELN